MKLCFGRSLPLLLAALLLPSSAALAVTLDWANVGDPGNAHDPSTGSVFGRVTVAYRISKTEVTNAEYTEFLNAVAATDTNLLYNVTMSSVPQAGGITQSGSPGTYAYSAIAGRENMPVNWVSFWDALRFANWLHNGQPTGLQDNSTTEDGAYTLTPTTIANNTVTRNAAAEFVIPTENEWYKAAYYDGAASYFAYPAGSSTATTCTTPGATANTANCDLAVVDVVDVSSYTASASPSGTFDQGGNLFEWNEAVIGGANRGLRGGGFGGTASELAAASRSDVFPAFEILNVGFRVAAPALPVPAPALSPIGIALLGALLALTASRRLRN